MTDRPFPWAESDRNPRILKQEEMGQALGQQEKVTNSLSRTFSRFSVCTSLRTSCGRAVFGRPVTCMCEFLRCAVYKMSEQFPRLKVMRTHRASEHLCLRRPVATDASNASLSFNSERNDR